MAGAEAISGLNGVQKDKPDWGKEHCNGQAKELKEVTPKDKTLGVYYFFLKRKETSCSNQKEFTRYEFETGKQHNIKKQSGIKPNA